MAHSTSDTSRISNDGISDPNSGDDDARQARSGGRRSSQIETRPADPPPDSRAARFLRDADVDDDKEREVAETAPMRRATYRPPEAVAELRDVVTAYRDALRDEADRRRPDAPEYAELVRAAAQCEEALGASRRARDLLSRLAPPVEQGEADGSEDGPEDGERGAVERVRRRLLRRIDDDSEAILASLRRSLDGAAGREAALLGLQMATAAWRDGAAPADILEHLDAIDAETIDGDWSVLWEAQLRTDALLEDGQIDAAKSHLAGAAERADTEDVAMCLAARAAVWEHVTGRPERAQDLLEPHFERGALPDDLANFYLDLGRETGRAVELGTLLDRYELPAFVVRAIAVEQAHRLRRRDRDGAGVDRLLACAGRRGDDRTVLTVARNFLERLYGRSDVGSDGDSDRQSAVSEQLLDVLNRLVEIVAADTERADLLVRLGRLYERETENEEAAAGVYREALEVAPGHSAATRALGRIYDARHNWEGLAELYRHQLEHSAETADTWRTHLRLARLLEDRVGRPEAALAQYRAVLQARGWHLPALKGAARQLGDLNRWAELVELFVESVDQAPSDGESSYLLQRAAEIAEERLGEAGLAIEAWQRVLELDPEHRAAYASLGRLLAREGRWQELVDLNIQQLEYLTTAEEAAELLNRSADIVVHHLGEPERAAQLYRAALNHVPDHLPALEGLGRLLARRGRWEEVAEVTEDELAHLDPGPERRNRLAALAELFEDRLERPDDAAQVWREILAEDSADAQARSQLLRLARSEGRWHDVCELLEQRARRRGGAQRGAALGEMALILEWRLEAPDAACEEYLRALEADVTQLEWLDGVVRCWPPSKNAPAEMADRLEDMVMQQMDAPVRDAFFKVIARLRERAETDAEASRGYRMHGDRECRENQSVLRFAMAQSSDRHQLVQSRRKSAHHALEWLASAPRHRLAKADRPKLDAVVGQLTDAERNFLAGEMTPVDMAAHIDPSMTPDRRLSAALTRLMEGEDEGPLADAEETTVVEARLRCEKARAAGDLEDFFEWVEVEVDRRCGRDGAVARWVDAARFARRADATQAVRKAHERAATAAFPQLAADASQDDASAEAQPGEGRENEDNFEGAVEEATLGSLYDSLESSGHWELLQSCLQAHVSKDGLAAPRRVELFERLADIAEDHLEDLESASRALSHCWQISERPNYLRRRVVIDRECGNREAALRHQRRHFDVVSRSDASENAVVQSGIWLADLLLAAGEDREDGIELLEMLRDTCESSEHGETVLRMLAYAYAEADRPYDAVDAFQRVLKFEVVDRELEDWRTLVDLYEHRLDDPQTAYSLQWRIVHSFPERREALARLVELAEAAGEARDCCDQLQRFASEAQISDAARSTLLARAARIAETTLGRPEDAVGFLDEALEVQSGDPEAARPLMRRRARCLADCTGREREAVGAFRELLDAEPFEPSTYRPALKVFERERAHDRARLTRQVLSAIDPERDPGGADAPRTKMRPARPVSDELVEDYLLPDELPAPVFHLLRQTMPLAHKVFSDELPQGKVLESTGLRPVDGHEVDAVVSQAMGAFEVGRHTVDSADNAPPQPQILSSGTPEVWLLSDQLDAMNGADLRFTAGWSAAVAWSELAPLLTLDGRAVWHLIEGTWLRHHGSGFEDRVDLESQRMADAISSPFLAMARRRVVHAAEPVVEELPDAPCELWPDALEEFAGRAGLVLSGNLAAAIRSVLRFRGWELGFDAPETRERIARTDLIEKLINFAYSEDYLEARYTLGLSGRPSEVGIG